jgi:high affinity Mn2+ porin
VMRAAGVCALWTGRAAGQGAGPADPAADSIRWKRSGVVRDSASGPVSIMILPLDAQTAGQMPATAPVTSSIHWNGWYVGGQTGLIQGNANAIVAGASPMGASSAFGHLDGGLQIGYNKVLSSRLVVGAAADLSFPDFLEDGIVSSTTTTQGGTVTEKIDFVATVRGRLGYAVDRWLIYGTAGVAPAQTHFIESSAAGNDQDDILRLRAGWALGAGAEFPIAPGWTASVEYLYERFEQAGAIFPAGTGIQSTPDVHNLRLGLRRTFSWPGPHRSSRVPGSPAAASAARWNIHGQDTFIEQGYFAFRSPYEGANSLTGASQAKNTESATAFLDARLWAGADLYFNPEIDQGSGLNTTHGVAAFPSGEAQKASFPIPRFVVDRLVLRQTFGLGGAREPITDGPNQLAGTRDISRITVAVGRLAVTDYFDVNAYANDPRTDFFNWNIYGAGAFDWTMDQISWTWGTLAELNQRTWACRVGYFLLPIVSSNNYFDMHIPERGEYAAEGEWRYSLVGQPGTVRLFGWVNHGTMGSYAAALALPVTTPNYPDITLTRQVRTNPGVVLNAGQAITANLGLFSRASWSPGQDEILGGTDCSRSVSLGGVLQGTGWGRPNDHIGVSGVVGGLSPAARAYFAAGGLGILIGDGQLNYRAEQVLETQYAYAHKRWPTLSFDYQFIVNPGYNADRGPVSIYAVRVHAAF